MSPTLGLSDHPSNSLATGAISQLFPFLCNLVFSPSWELALGLQAHLEERARKPQGPGPLRERGELLDTAPQLVHQTTWQDFRDSGQSGLWWNVLQEQNNLGQCRLPDLKNQYFRVKSMKEIQNKSTTVPQPQCPKRSLAPADLPFSAGSSFLCAHSPGPGRPFQMACPLYGQTPTRSSRPTSRSLWVGSLSWQS